MGADKMGIICPFLDVSIKLLIDSVQQFGPKEKNPTEIMENQELEMCVVCLETIDLKSRFPSKKFMCNHSKGNTTCTTCSNNLNSCPICREHRVNL